jgi:putative flippase GtrA
LAAFNFFIQVAVFNFSLEVVNLGVLASLMLSSGIAAITGFIGMKYWVFSERERK